MTISNNQTWNGYPEQAHQDGWHVLKLHSRPVGIPFFWNSLHKKWQDNQRLITTYEISSLYSYCYPLVGSTVWTFNPTRCWTV